MAGAPDRIVKSILLRATRQRVWDAIADHRQFGEWFGMRFHAPFTAGATVRATIVGTTVDPATAERQRQYEGIEFDVVVERIEPQRLLSFRWHPGGIEAGVDYTREPMTLVEFTLADAPGGILLTVTESGFDRLPPERRANAFNGNAEGWAICMTLLERYVAQSAAHAG